MAPIQDPPLGCIKQLAQGGGISLSIHAKPGAKVSAVTGLDDDVLGVSIDAPPRGKEHK